MANENKGLSTQPIQPYSLFRRKNTTMSDNEPGMVSEARPNMVVNETKTQPYTAVNGTGNPYEYRDQAFKDASKAASANVVGGVSGNAQTQPTYVEKLAEQKEAAKKQYQPGENVSGWINRNFASPKSDGSVQSNKGDRQTIQNIAAITDVLRHAANLYYTSKGATPQNIQSQVAMNQAKWQAEDALEQQREKARQEMELKRREQQRKEDKDERTLAQGDLRNQIALGNYNLALGKDARQAKADEMNLTVKQAGLDKQKHDMELADKKFDADQKQRGIQNGIAQQRLALGWANHNLSALRLARSSGGGGKNGGRSVGKKGDGSATFVTPSGVRYTLSKDYQNNIGQVYDAMVKKGIIKGLTKTDSFGKPYQARPSKADMINAVMKAADSRNGHDDFVWWGKKLGYQYVDGMTHETSNRVGGGMGYAGQSV